MVREIADLHGSAQIGGAGLLLDEVCLNLRCSGVALLPSALNQGLTFRLDFTAAG